MWDGLQGCGFHFASLAQAKDRTSAYVVPVVVVGASCIHCFSEGDVDSGLHRALTLWNRVQPLALRCPLRVAAGGKSASFTGILHRPLNVSWMAALDSLQSVCHLQSL